KDGYTLDAFVSGENNSSYGPSEATNAPDKEDGDRITGDMTLTATWLLKDTFAEIPVDVYLDDELYGEYIKAYEKDETGKKVSVQIPNSFLKTGIDSIDV